MFRASLGKSAFLSRLPVGVGLLTALGLLVSTFVATSSDAAPPSIRYEAESLPVVSSTGDRVIIPTSSCPGKKCLIYAADAIGDSITLSVTVPEARPYLVKLAVKRFYTRGVFQLAIQGAPNPDYDGSFNDLGRPTDLYARSQSFTDVTMGTVSFGTSGTKNFRFTVTGKNAASKGHTVGIDAIILVPQDRPASTTTTVAPVPSIPATTTTTSTHPKPAPTTTLVPTTTMVKPSPAGKPDASNTGVPAGTSLTRYTGPSTITADNTVIEGKAIYADLKVEAKNVVIRNSYLHCGTGIPGGNTGCVDATGAGVYNLLVENNTIIPDHPSYYRDGIVGHEYTARGNHIARTNDGLGIFNRKGLSTKANVTADRNYIHSLTHWNRDPAHKDGTHNDGIQIQGGENIHIHHNNIVASAVAGDGLGVYGNHSGAGILVGPHISPSVNIVIENNWLDDAMNTVCIQEGPLASVSVTLRNNLFGRNQYTWPNGREIAIRINSKSKSTVIGLNTNRFEDNLQPLSDANRTSGIYYNYL